MNREPLWLIYVPHSRTGPPYAAKQIRIKFAQICRRQDLQQAVQTALSVGVAFIIVRLDLSAKRLAQLIDPGVLNEARLQANQK